MDWSKNEVLLEYHEGGVSGKPDVKEKYKYDELDVDNIMNFVSKYYY